MLCLYGAILRVMPSMVDLEFHAIPMTEVGMSSSPSHAGAMSLRNPSEGSSHNNADGIRISEISSEYGVNHQ